MNDKRVFAIEQHKFSLAPVREFGDVVQVFTQHERLPAMFSPDYRVEMLRRVGEQEFDPTRDYVVATGSTAQWTIALGALLSKYKHLKVLLFNATTRRYIVVEV